MVCVIGSVGITLLGDYVSVLSIQSNLIIFTHHGLSNEPYTVPHHQRLQKKAVKRKHGKPEVTVMYEKEADNIIA